ncbi:MAG: hypothetical protein OXE79_09795 [Acidimicrobiaceae bacterium]|nr:hypothetical protein [Acidimicrobiaceae bacterium]MCY4281201.1 hypothetical protein [Acidimicrobiaceae bacterium]MCY4294061.1 hypothetical protein [Acidimicrobiaceae bacterium]
MAAASDQPFVMRSVRLLALFAIAGLMTAGALVDLPDRTRSEAADRHVPALAAPTAAVNTWFCPGGSGPSGAAELTIVIANASREPRSVDVQVLSGGAGADDPVSQTVELAPLEHLLVRPSDAAPDASWVAAMVETRSSDVIVEQILTAPQAGLGRSLCLTRTAESWVVSNGATRAAVEGERFVLMLLNPFPDVAVADIELVADVGRDSIEGLVVPAQRVVAVDVTEEVTVAATVAAFVEVVSGRVAASWIQVADGPNSGSGTRAAPAAPGSARLWHLPVAGVGPGRRDIVAVSNPSRSDVAEVDLEILTEDPAVRVSPIELTVRAGRTALVDLSEQARLEGVGNFSVAVRSLNGAPVAASVTSVTVAGSAAADGDPADVAPEGPRFAETGVAGSAATSGADAASKRWLVPVEATERDLEADGSAGGSLTVVNPSALGIVEATVSVAGELLRSVELGPGRSRTLPLPPLREAAGVDRFVVEVAASSPVIVGRELVGLTSRSASLGAAVAETAPVVAIR